MLLHQDNHGGGTFVAAHVTNFTSIRKAWRWRRSACRELPDAPGLVFAKALPFIGSGASSGFGGGVPALQRQVLLTAWRQEADFEHFLGQPPAQRLAAEARHSWWSLFQVASTRGSHYGSTPLSSREKPVADGPFAALTLGRVRSRSLPRFLREGARLGTFTRQAPGLVSAVSAGWPPTGNCTISIWESEQHMLRFAYGDVEGHGETVRREPPVLTEQLNARLRVRRLSDSWGPDAMHPQGLDQLAAALSKEGGG
jgi:heme-degrading monooxygenase HmoA